MLHSAPNLKNRCSLTIFIKYISESPELGTHVLTDFFYIPHHDEVNDRKYTFTVSHCSNSVKCYFMSVPMNTLNLFVTIVNVPLPPLIITIVPMTIKRVPVIIMNILMTIVHVPSCMITIMIVPVTITNVPMTIMNVLMTKLTTAVE